MDWTLIAVIAVVALLTFPIWIYPVMIAGALMLAGVVWFGTILWLLLGIAVCLILLPFAWLARLWGGRPEREDSDGRR